MKASALRFPLLTAIVLSACASTYSDAGSTPRNVTSRAPYLGGRAENDARAITSGPYRVVVEGPDAVTLPTFYDDGRAYVMGTLGQRYRVRISNPTAVRVEVVVSIDGLDAIDGEPADFASKHGYVIAAHDDLVVEGFRTSVEQVAAFRFSSVPDSYAARKGKDRHVGVIGVAFFRERQPVDRAPRPLPYQPWGRGAPEPPSTSAPSPHASTDDAPSSAGAAPTGAAEGWAPADRAAPAARSSRRSAPRRAGLGTEFGEARDSHVDYTRFERASEHAPTALFELRYNDRQGLLALGIDVDHAHERDDLSLRESADPFPARNFATPPPP